MPAIHFCMILITEINQLQGMFLSADSFSSALQVKGESVAEGGEGGGFFQELKFLQSFFIE